MKILKIKHLKYYKKKTLIFFYLQEENLEDNIEYSNLNCTIYLSSGSSFGNYGLKNAGESFTITINESFNLSYENLENLNFEENFSLHFEDNTSTKKI